MSTTTTGAPAAPVARKRRNSGRYVPYAQVGATLALLIIMLIVGSLLYANFTSPQALLDLLSKNSFLIPLAVGMTFVILTGGIDLSVGAMMALGAVMAAWLMQGGLNPGLTIVVVLVAGTVLGLGVGFVIHKFEIQPFIATLAAMFLARGLCLVITDRAINIENEFFRGLNTPIELWETTRTSRSGRVTDIPVTTTPLVFIALALVVIAFFVLHYTRFGRTVYAVGGGEHSASLMGLAVGRTKVAVYAISGFCGALSGLLFAMYTNSGDPIFGIGYELNAIAAVVIGGTLLAGGAGYVWGSLLGVLVIGVIYAYKDFDGGLNTGWTRVLVGALLLFFIVLQRVIAARVAKKR